MRMTRMRFPSKDCELQPLSNGEPHWVKASLAEMQRGKIELLAALLNAVEFASPSSGARQGYGCSETSSQTSSLPW
jgi:hypothetical protein